MARMPKTTAEQIGRARLLIVDDQPIVREYLAQFINNEPDLHACPCAEGALGAFELIATHRPNLVITGLALKDSHGLEFIKDLRTRYPGLPVLVFSMYDESLYAERAIRAGASGFVSKHGPTKELICAIRRILAGQMYLSERLTEHAVEQFFERPSLVKESRLQQLSDRELEVFELVGEGRSTSQIARVLHLDSKTIETYRARIKVKLKINTTAEFIQRAQQALHQSRSSQSSD